MTNAYEDDSDNESFKSAHDEVAAPDSVPERFSLEDEKDLLAKSQTSKTAANALFAASNYTQAIQSYDTALAQCPNYLDYEVAVLNSNVAACRIKLKEWKEAVHSATKSLDCLERLDPVPKSEAAKGEVGGGGNTGTGARGAGQSGDTDTAGVVEEVNDEVAARIEALEKTGHTLTEVHRLRIKALLRRAHARSTLGGWQNLQGADEDYRQLSSMSELGNIDRETVRKAMRTLPPRLERAKQDEMGEMMGKLKELGNGILKPFGLSTENFQFTQDPKSGGYSMNFNQGK